MYCYNEVLRIKYSHLIGKFLYGIGLGACLIGKYAENDERVIVHLFKFWKMAWLQAVFYQCLMQLILLRYLLQFVVYRVVYIYPVKSILLLCCILCYHNKA